MLVNRPRILGSALTIGIIAIAPNLYAQASEATQITQTNASLALLEKQCSDPDFFQRAKAITKLSYLRSPDERKLAHRKATEHLKDKEWLVRHAALNALRRMQAPEVRWVALWMVKDPAPHVRQVAEKIVAGTHPGKVY